MLDKLFKSFSFGKNYFIKCNSNFKLIKNLSKKGSFDFFFPIIIFCSLLLLVIFSILSISPRFTGQVSVTAEGGKIINTNIVLKESPSFWVGVHGLLINSSLADDYSVFGNQVLEINLSYSSPSLNTIILASTSSNPDWSNLSSASYSNINSFLGVNSSNKFSAENTFSLLHNFTVENSTYELLSARTISFSGSFITGAMLTNNFLLFVTDYVENGTGFSNSSTDFQFILPVNGSGSTNYSFFVREDYGTNSSVLDVSCNSSFNLSAVLGSDNFSVDLSWDDVGASSYEVSYLSGSQDGFLNFSNATSISVGSNLSWSDSDNVSERYYKIKAISSSSCLSPDTAGTLVLNLSPDYNLISSPFIPLDNTVPEVLRSISGSYISVNEFDNVAKNYFFYVIVGNNIFKNFNTIKPGRGYWIRSSYNSSLRLLGSLANNISIDVSPDYNLIGFPIIHNGNKDETVSYVLSSINGNYSSVNEYNNIIKSYSFYVIVGNNIFKNFNTIKPGRGYWVKANNNDSLYYENDLIV